MTSGTGGRLAKPPHPVLSKLLYDPGYDAELRYALPRLLDIDAAHVVMLAERRILANEVAAQLLGVNRALARQVAANETVLARSDEPHRGMYFRYEREYVARLGAEIGGAAHVARSRNDINATLTRMRLRDELTGVIDDALGLARALGNAGRTHLTTVICGFTHRQPAQPTTLGHYVAGALAELVRTTRWLEDAYLATNRSPLGAAAGFGTSFPVDPDRVAALLGFEEVIANAGDAVASRDFVVHAASAMASAGILLTRLTTDLQEWAGLAYELVTWPDDLVSTSSIMPQKRNPYVLETIRGRASQITGALVNTLIGMKSAPWTNSVEVSAEAVQPIWSACDHARVAFELMMLLIANMVVTPARMERLLRASGATMTALADLLVARHGVAFRTAHDIVATLVNELPAGELDVRELRARLVRLGDAGGCAIDIDHDALAATLDPVACVFAAAYGGGPAPVTVAADLDRLDAKIASGAARSLERRRSLVAAREQLAGAIDRILSAP